MNRYFLLGLLFLSGCVGTSHVTCHEGGRETFSGTLNTTSYGNGYVSGINGNGSMVILTGDCIVEVQQ